MSRRFRISTLVVLAAFALTLATGVLAGDDWKQISRPGEKFFDETFSMSDGMTLRVKLHDADVELVQGGQGEARVEVFVKGKNEDKAKEYFDKMRFSASEDNNTLHVETRPRRNGWSFWGSFRHANMRVVVTIPKGTRTYVKTSDGDVQTKSLEGNTQLRTSDGDILVGTLSGEDVVLATSDGDINADELSGGEIEIKTSDGDVEAGKVNAKTITCSTSDGDVSLGSASAEVISLSSSDGDIRVDADSDRLKARTSDGDIVVTIASATEMNLRTSDGNVTINAPAGINADLDLRGGRIRVHGEVGIKGEMSKHKVIGTLGGGGVEIVARTSDGSISLDLR